jgi:hypothetical protein
MVYEFPFTVTAHNAQSMRSPSLFAFGFMEEKLPIIYAADPGSDLERMGPAIKAARGATERTLMLALNEAVRRLQREAPLNFSVGQTPYPVRDDDPNGDWVYSGFRVVAGEHGAFDFIYWVTLAKFTNHK